jgi:hypothetical protein
MDFNRKEYELSKGNDRLRFIENLKNRKYFDRQKGIIENSKKYDDNLRILPILLIFYQPIRLTQYFYRLFYK